jgi:taurine dioxygenase
MTAVLTTSKTASPLNTRRLTGRIGAEIRDIKLGGGLSRDDVVAIRQTLLANRVVFFRDQTQFDDVQQEAFSRLLGDIVPHPTEAVRAGSTGILELDAAAGNGKADQWHTDVTFMDAFPRYSILRAVTIPAYGGDTLWATTVAAYNDLSPQLKQLAESLWAIHSNKYDYASTQSASTAAERAHYEKVFASNIYEAQQPVVRIHPETGEKSIVLGQFVQRIVGHNQLDSNLLFQMLQAHVTRPENTVRWSWRQNDVAIWDNQATQHYAINDYDDQNRTMRRTTIAGEVTVSVDGKRATMVRQPGARNAAE